MHRTLYITRRIFSTGSPESRLSEAIGEIDLWETKQGLSLQYIKQPTLDYFHPTQQVLSQRPSLTLS